MRKQKIKTMRMVLCSLGLSLGGFTNAEVQDKTVKINQIRLDDMVKKELFKSKIISAKMVKGENNDVAGETDFTTKIILKSKEEAYSTLSTESLLNNKEFLSLYLTRDLKKLEGVIYDMQSFSSYINDTYKIDNELAEEIVFNTFIESHRANISPLLMLSLIGIESSYNHKARSGMGARGLTQVMPEYHQDKIRKFKVDLTSIKGNIKVGVAVFKEYMVKDNGNIKKALQRYNGSYYDKSYAYSNKVFKKMEILNSIREERLV